ncbi:MAG: hypothetical protein Q8N02_00315 [Methylotenera sp.]|nr:hypothetical protein [Methylotenera sp.]MDP3094012.1 hypothetical protein [Methylotenera sp.]
MSWKFWEKKKEEPPRTSDDGLPTDLYRHAVLVGASFARSAPPFDMWRDPTVDVPVALEPTFQRLAQSFQVREWMVLVADKHGSQASKHALDAFCLQVARERGTSDARQMFNNFVEIGNVTARAVKSATNDENKQGANMPWTYFAAKEMLVKLREQLQHNKADDDFKGNEVLLSQCISHATDRASEVFDVMLRNVRYMPETFEEWLWSTHPGGYERHMQRRWNNPLFRDERRKVMVADVYSAWIKDSAAIDELEVRVQDLLAEWQDGPSNKCNDLEWCYDNLKKVDELITAYYKIGGDLVVLETLQSARRHVIEWWKEGLADNSEGLQALELAEQKWKEFEYLDNAFVQQASNPEYISLDELAEALLSEPTDNIRAYCDYIVSMNKDDPLPILRNVALDLVRSATDECMGRGEDVPDWKDKLDALGASFTTAKG